MTGVSQATVSVVLNGRSESEVRIAPETRDRVLRAIAETGYVADPVARRLAARHNKIIGVFTYESVFPSANSDFYHPFLVGIEQRAETIGCDLLLLTSAPVVDGRRRIFHEDNRLRLADGCVLLGRSLDRAELTRLVADELSFVSIGRRDDAGGPVPYVGADYPTAVAALVHRAVSLGHTRLAYLGHGTGPESWADRMLGFRNALADTGAYGLHLPLPSAGDPHPATSQSSAEIETYEDVDHERVLAAIIKAKITAVFAEDHADGVVLHQLAAERGVPLSIATLGEPMRAASPINVEFSGFRIPREQMGSEAVEVLAALIEGSPTDIQRLLHCELVVGETLTERK
ncbi:MAG TPA: LacI family transcriptional regulator [Micromonosporaceae bacterium]|nr:LacI family transcriptional regulator [Micromonosporaceae bacterium]